MPALQEGVTMERDTIKVGFILILVIIGMSGAYYYGYSDGLKDTHSICDICKNITQPTHTPSQACPIFPNGSVCPADATGAR
jgi:hypothetical protein